MDSSQYPQPLWERAVAQLQANGQPLTAQSIQAMMNTLAGDPDPVEGGSSIDAAIDKTLGGVPDAAPNPPAVTSKPLPPIGKRLDQQAYNNMIAENAQGPGKLKSDDASAPDARGGANTTEDTSNYAPGTQDAQTSAAAPYWNAPVAPNGMATSFNMPSGDAATKGGMLAAIMATLSKRYKPSMGQSIHLGNVQAPNAASMYEGVITKATPEEMAKARRTSKDKKKRRE